MKGSEYVYCMWISVCYNYFHLSLTCGSPHITRQSGWWRRKPRQRQWPRAATLCRRGEQWSSPRPASRPCESAHTRSLVHSHSLPRARTQAKTGYTPHRIWGKKERKARSKLFFCAQLFHLDQTPTSVWILASFFHELWERGKESQLHLSPFVSHLLSFSPYWLSVIPRLTLLSTAGQFRGAILTFSCRQIHNQQAPNLPICMTASPAWKYDACRQCQLCN